jgi:hypothetical protein
MSEEFKDILTGSNLHNQIKNSHSTDSIEPDSGSVMA